MVIHPSQIEVVRDVYRPTSDEVARARAALASVDQTRGVAVLADGTFIDVAMLQRHRLVLQLAEQLGTAS